MGNYQVLSRVKCYRKYENMKMWEVKAVEFLLLDMEMSLRERQFELVFVTAIIFYNSRL